MRPPNFRRTGVLGLYFLVCFRNDCLCYLVVFGFIYASQKLLHFRHVSSMRCYLRLLLSLTWAVPRQKSKREHQQPETNLGSDWVLWSRRTSIQGSHISPRACIIIWADLSTFQDLDLVWKMWQRRLVLLRFQLSFFLSWLLWHCYCTRTPYAVVPKYVRKGDEDKALH